MGTTFLQLSPGPLFPAVSVCVRLHLGELLVQNLDRVVPESLTIQLADMQIGIEVDDDSLKCFGFKGIAPLIDLIPPK